MTLKSALCLGIIALVTLKSAFGARIEPPPGDGIANRSKCAR